MLLKKGDKILIIVVLVIAAILFAFFAISRKKPEESDGKSAGEVTVMIDKEVYGVYSLDEDQQITVNTDEGTNTFEIKNGEVNMLEANCPDLICVNYKPIHYVHDTIVCLPHKLVLEITQGSERESDALDG